MSNTGWVVFVVVLLSAGAWALLKAFLEVRRRR